MRVFIPAVTAALLSTSLAAQERPNTILVLDASGSMWGQIDGVNKIVIARDVVADILADFPADQNLGLTLYGHRTRGECTDIETVIAPGIDNRQAILDAVNTINPRGMTPMTDAIVAAAESLRYTETAATVILVSDGIETCNPDPCAAARALEEVGVGFTAHVVGFDVANEPEALAQMQCLAEETGGLFLTAANADELAAALEAVVAEAPPPEPPAEPAILPQATIFRATLGEGGPEIDTPLIWELLGPDGAVLQSAQAPGFSADLLQGAYAVSVLRPEDEAFAEATVIVMDDPQTVTLVLPPPALSATLVAQPSAPVGATIPVGWEGPEIGNDFVAIGLPGEGYINYAYTSRGNPAELLMPPRPGDYEIRYYTAPDEQVIAAIPITVTPVEVALTAPATAAAGAPVPVGWTGPGYRDDFIGIGLPGDRYTNYVYTNRGNPAELVMPPEPGTYELRYYLGQDESILASATITVEEVAVALTAPATAAIGATVDVGWTGPGYDNDFIGIGLPGDRYTNYVYTNRGNPAELQMPSAPGTYELRYYLGQDESILATATITVEDVDVALTAPASAPAGATIDVGWTGPGVDNDFIGVGLPGEGYGNYVYVNRGNPAPLTLPAVPGTYELRYYLGQDESTLAAATIEVTAVTAQLVAPATGTTGSDIPVGWDGPGYDNDFIGISLAGEPGYLTYTYTNRGNPVTITLPDTPGDYEIRYFLGQDESVLTAVPLTVTKP